MTDGTVAQHPPAMKVGGRRLSISIKHKAPISAEAAATTPKTAEDKNEVTVPDYPRPTPHAVGDEAPQQAHRNEEVPPKKEKKHIHSNKFQEYPHWKTETTRPTRDLNGGNKGQMGTRIGQPAGKSLDA